MEPDEPDRGSDTGTADGADNPVDTAVLRAVRDTTRDGRAPSTRTVAEHLTSAGAAVSAGTEPWWGLETRARELEKRGLLRVRPVRDEHKSPAEAMRTTDDYGLEITDAGRTTAGSA